MTGEYVVMTAGDTPLLKRMKKNLHSAIVKWMPYVSFDIRPVLSVDQAMESITRVVAAAKK